MPLRPDNDLWSHVLWSAADGLHAVHRMLRKSEICDLNQADIILLRQEKVLQFQVAVNHVSEWPWRSRIVTVAWGPGSEHNRLSASEHTRARAARKHLLDCNVRFLATQRKASSSPRRFPSILTCYAGIQCHVGPEQSTAEPLPRCNSRASEPPPRVRRPSAAL